MLCIPLECSRAYEAQDGEIVADCPRTGRRNSGRCNGDRRPIASVWRGFGCGELQFAGCEPVSEPRDSIMSEISDPSIARYDCEDGGYPVLEFKLRGDVSRVLDTLQCTAARDGPIPLSMYAVLPGLDTLM